MGCSSNVPNTKTNHRVGNKMFPKMSPFIFNKDIWGTFKRPKFWEDKSIFLPLTFCHLSGVM